MGARGQRGSAVRTYLGGQWHGKDGTQEGAFAGLTSMACLGCRQVIAAVVGLLGMDGGAELPTRRFEL